MEQTVKDALDIFRNKWNQQIILYGPPGTSKTYSAKIIAAMFLLENTDLSKTKLKDEIKKIKEKIDNNKIDNNKIINDEDANTILACDEFKNRFKLIQFHPSYTYEDFVRGISIKNDNDKISYEVESKIFEKFCMDNQKNNENEDKTCVLVIDEINRAPLSSVLGELIYGLEYRDEEITTPYEMKEPLKVPKNLYIIGTMNTADRTIGSIDYAVRRRFAFIPVMPYNPETNKNNTENNTKNNFIISSWHNKEIGEKAYNIYTKIYEFFDNKENMEDSDVDKDDIRIGHTYFLGQKKKSSEIDNDQKSSDPDVAIEKKYLKYRINYQVKPILVEYVKDGLINREKEDELFKDIDNELENETEKDSNTN